MLASARAVWHCVTLAEQCGCCWGYGCLHLGFSSVGTGVTFKLTFPDAELGIHEHTVYQKLLHWPKAALLRLVKMTSLARAKHQLVTSAEGSYWSCCHSKLEALPTVPWGRLDRVTAAGHWLYLAPPGEHCEHVCVSRTRCTLEALASAFNMHSSTGTFSSGIHN